MPTDDRPAGTEVLVRYIVSRYGDRFDDERRERVSERIATYRRAGDAVSKIDLSNADEPAFAFEAYRRDQHRDDVENERENDNDGAGG